ncbi:MAG: C_GCAxxG_C_C family protein [Clostridiales bacterium]|nr:C_GCAxxG_C_C family protein [Clostridiales bacterium]
MAYAEIDKDLIRVDGNGENRADKAKRMFMEGYNCSQSVAVSFCDLFGVDENIALRMSASFGGGMGRMREVCGAFSGIIMILGLFAGQTEGEDREAKKENYRLVQEAAELFRAKNGSIICREILGLTKAEGTFVPEPRTEEYYKKRPCPETIRGAAQILIDMLEKYAV